MHVPGNFDVTHDVILRCGCGHVEPEDCCGFSKACLWGYTTRLKQAVILPAHILLFRELLEAVELLPRPVRIQIFESWAGDKRGIGMGGNVGIAIWVRDTDELIDDVSGGCAYDGRGPKRHVLYLKPSNCILVPRPSNLSNPVSLVEHNILCVRWYKRRYRLLPRYDDVQHLSGVSDDDLLKSNAPLSSVV